MGEVFSLMGGSDFVAGHESAFWFLGYEDYLMKHCRKESTARTFWQLTMVSSA
jgi:hypothetical protein